MGEALVAGDQHEGFDVEEGVHDLCTKEKTETLFFLQYIRLFINRISFPATPHGHHPISIIAGGARKPAPGLDNFRHLRAYLAVCDSGSIERASTLLVRPKSSVARSVQGVEALFGVALFERGAGRMRCNAHGDVVRRHGERALREFGAGLCALDRRARRDADGASLDFSDSLFHESRLQAFVAVADTGHLPTAAGRLGLTLLRVSRSINDLERSLDTLLFTRTSAGMVPTDGCRTFSLHVRRSLAELTRIGPELAALDLRRSA
jgi:LysR family transcriptional regulator of gallate degradation